MNFVDVPVLYTIYDGEILYPVEINVGLGNMVKNPIEEHLSPAGLVFPYNRAMPLGGLPIEYLDSKEYTWNTSRMFLLLRNDGVLEEYFHDDNPRRLLAGRISPIIKRMVFSDEQITKQMSSVLTASKNIDHYANLLERRFGFDVRLWKIYNIKQLHQFVLGNITADKIKSRDVKSEFKTIWLK